MIPLEELLRDDVDDDGLEPIATSPFLEPIRLRLPRLRVPRPRLNLRLRRPRVRVSAELLEDASLLAGLASIAAGAGWIYPPAAAIVGGGFLVWLGLRAAGRAAKDPELREERTIVVEKHVYGDDEED